MYYEIWQEREHISFLSGKSLESYFGTDYFRNMFAHVLAKGQNKYPRFKTYKKNIVLLTPYEHHLFDNGTIEQRQKYADETGCDWGKLYDLMNGLKDEYKRL